MSSAHPTHALGPSHRRQVVAGLIPTLSMLARSESLLRKHFAGAMLLRISKELAHRQQMLDVGCVRTLCFLCRSSLPRKVVRPAATALCTLCSDGTCVAGLVESGTVRVLTALGTSSDPEMVLDACHALADLLEADAADNLRTVEQLLQQGGLSVFLSAAHSQSKPAQLYASRGPIACQRAPPIACQRAPPLRLVTGLLVVSRTSPLHARVLAKKGGARALAALLLGKDETLLNALTTIWAMASALSAADKEPLSKSRLAKVRSVLDVGVVGTSKELWARLNEGGGVPAAQLMRLARSANESMREMARKTLGSLQPGLLEQLDIDVPQESGYSAEAIANRNARQKCIAKIQKRYRMLITLQVCHLPPSPYDLPRACI